MYKYDGRLTIKYGEEELFLRREFNHTQYANYLRFVDDTGVKGVESWINRPWELWTGQTAFLKYMAKCSLVSDEFKQVVMDYAKKHEIHSGELVLEKGGKNYV